MIYNSNLNLTKNSKVLRSSTMMKLIVIVILIQIIRADTIEPIEDFVSGQLITKQLEYDYKCPANTQGPICADDCNTLLACVPETTVPSEIMLCSNVSQSRPFCIPGTRSCVAAGDPTISNCSSSHPYPKFQCTSTGYFPDPRDCKKYHVCTGETSKLYECPPRYIYDAGKRKCKRRRNLRDCPRIKCTRSNHKYVVYPSYKAYYAYCESNHEIIMFKCQDSENFEFNPEKRDCEFVCRAEGTYPNYRNRQLFYECYKRRGRLVSRIQRCPNKYVFHPRIKSCVKNPNSTIPTTMGPTTTEPTTTEPTTTEPTTTEPTTTEPTTTEPTTTEPTTTEPTTTEPTTTEPTTMGSNLEEEPGDTIIKHQQTYSYALDIPHSDMSPTSKPLNNTWLIEWLLNSK